jgi:hypothetical protein
VKTSEETDLTKTGKNYFHGVWRNIGCLTKHVPEQGGQMLYLKNLLKYGPTHTLSNLGNAYIH